MKTLLAVLLVAAVVVCAGWTRPRPDNPDGSPGHLTGGGYVIYVPTDHRGVWARCLMRVHYRPSCRLFWRQQP